MLNDANLALLISKLEIPMVMTDILKDPDSLKDDAQYALHATISDMQPDTALLAIAASARKVAAECGRDMPGLNILKMECDRIIEEYGPIWLQNAQHKMLDEDDVFDVLMNTAEDLDSLSELLSSAYVFLRHSEPVSAQLCDILHVQAASHALIAKAFMEVADKAVADGINSANLVADGDNIIQFPRRV